MASHQLPSYFVSRDGAPGADIAAGETPAPAHVLDFFSVGGRHRFEREWIVAADALGGLAALPDEGRGDFPEAIRTELAYHEVSGSYSKRVIEAAEFFIFNLQLLEQPVADARDFDAPVYLYGSLSGPYPGRENRSPACVEGQLTVTRLELLESLVREAEFAFRYAGTDDRSEFASRCFHLLLPADREGEVRRGRGLVLAYPLLPPELMSNDLANEIVVSQLAYDILSVLKENLVSSGIAHPLCSLTLPVPSRFALEQKLRAEGYEIEGDTAVKKTERGEGFQGRLAAIFGSLMAETLELPAEGSVDDFIAIAERTLAALPVQPSPHTLAVRSLVKLSSPEDDRRSQSRQQPAILIKVPAANTLTPSQPPRQQQEPTTPVTERSDQPPAWMQDFILAHSRAGEPSPRLTSVAVEKTARPGKPDWMEDFERKPIAGRSKSAEIEKADAEDEAAAKMKPEWMKDFE